MTDERMTTGLEVTTGRAADTKILETLVEKSQKNGVEVEEVLGDKAYSSYHGDRRDPWEAAGI